MDCLRAALNALTHDRRYGSGVWRYSAKSMGQTIKQGGTADIDLFVLDRASSVGDVFYFK